MRYDGPIDSDQFQAHLDRGWDLVSRGDTTGALASAQKSLELDADSPEAHNLLGYVLAAEGHADEALDHYRHAIDLDDTFVDAMLNAADVLLRPVGDATSALSLIEDALDLIDDEQALADALLLKVDTLMIQGEEAAARRALARVPATAFSENPMLEFLVGRAYFELGDVESATPHLERVATTDPDQGEVQYYVGLLREKQERRQDATIAFLRSRELDLALPRPPWSLPLDQFETRVQKVLSAIAPRLGSAIEGALVHISDAPGPEVVADGVDPRACALFDAGTRAPAGEEQRERPLRTPVLFLYQRNIERVAEDLAHTEEVLEQAISQEIQAARSGRAAADADAASAEDQPQPPP